MSAKLHSDEHNVLFSNGLNDLSLLMILLLVYKSLNNLALAVYWQSFEEFLKPT